MPEFRLVQRQDKQHFELQYVFADGMNKNFEAYLEMIRNHDNARRLQLRLMTLTESTTGARLTTTLQLTKNLEQLHLVSCKLSLRYLLEIFCHLNRMQKQLVELRLENCEIQHDLNSEKTGPPAKEGAKVVATTLRLNLSRKNQLFDWHPIPSHPEPLLPEKDKPLIEPESTHAIHLWSLSLNLVSNSRIGALSHLDLSGYDLGSQR